VVADKIFVLWVTNVGRYALSLDEEYVLFESCQRALKTGQGGADENRPL
jgi:hypothetical protein